MTRLSIASGENRLDAVLVKPASAEVRAALLICHGIGETVDHWIRAQELLAENGVASLVFNYAGCGRSTGWISADGCERDAAAAFEALQQAVPGVRVSLLGFSLGSGVAAAVAQRLAPARLVLCAGYPAFREAAYRFGVPRVLCGVVPDLWRSEATLAGCSVPVLVVHGDRDRLFPVEMGERLARASGGGVGGGARDAARRSARAPMRRILGRNPAPDPGVGRGLMTAKEKRKFSLVFSLPTAYSRWRPEKVG